MSTEPIGMKIKKQPKPPCHSTVTNEGSDTELKCVRDARIPESKNYGFPVKLWLSPDNSVKSGFQCWIPSRFRLDSETSVRDSGVCRTPR